MGAGVSTRLHVVTKKKDLNHGDTENTEVKQKVVPDF